MANSSIFGPLKEVYETYRKQVGTPQQPTGLYAPINYTMELDAKRLRPILLLFFGDAYGAQHLHTLPMAHGIELFHNFTLVHDDIMDNADLRRGKESVYKKWDINTAILSGDAMMMMAYQFLVRGAPEQKLKQTLEIFNRKGLGVCEGQQYDMDLELNTTPDEKQYHEMIARKTADLLSCSMMLGALSGDVSENELKSIEILGNALGVAFQLVDDILDVFGDTKVGKRKGGDLIENKKTNVYFELLRHTNTAETQEVLHYFSLSAHGNKEKVDPLVRLMTKYDVEEKCYVAVEKHIAQALSMIQTLHISKAHKSALADVFDKIMLRKS